MSVLQKLKRLYQKINEEGSIFDVPTKKQRKFLESLPEPKDDLERSYLQYRCQTFLMRKGLPILLNCAAIPLLFLYERKLRGVAKSEDAEKSDAVFLFGGNPNIMPDILHEEFQILQIRDFQGKMCLTKEDLAYLRTIKKRYPFAFYFRLKCMLKLAMYSYVMETYQPRAVICSEEYSYTCSFLTDYCRYRGVEHINIMHGEKLYFIRDTFVHFDRFYVWDQHYIDLFLKLRGEKSQFQIQIPPSLQFSDDKSVEKTVDYTYYLGNESREQVEVILENLKRLQEKGKNVAIRIHPVYFSHSEFLCEDSQGFEIEQKSDCTIEESLQRTGCAVSLYSTVLLQAAVNGVEFAVDDCSNPELFKKLTEMDFICLKNTHKLLSELTG